MTFSLVLDILFELLKNRKITAPTLSEKYGVSPRTIYRCVEKLSPVLPLHIRRGRGGGIFLSDTYRLPADYLTFDEYEGTIDALSRAYERSPESRYLSAKRKLSAQKKEVSPAPFARADLANVFIFLGNDTLCAERLRTIRTAVQKRRILRLLYRDGELVTEGSVEPHALVFAKNEWYLCAFCHKKRAFFPFPLDRLEGVLQTEEPFRPRPFSVQAVFGENAP